MWTRKRIQMKEGGGADAGKYPDAATTGTRLVVEETEVEVYGSTPLVPCCRIGARRSDQWQRRSSGPRRQSMPSVFRLK